MKDISASSCLTYQHPVTQHQAETQNNVVAVDGSEILSSAVEVGSLSHYLQGFKQIPGGFLAGLLMH